MSDDHEMMEQVDAIDRHIETIRFRIDQTESCIRRLIKLNDSRRKQLRMLGQERSVILTEELPLEFTASTGSTALTNPVSPVQ